MFPFSQMKDAGCCMSKWQAHIEAFLRTFSLTNAGVGKDLLHCSVVCNDNEKIWFAVWFSTDKDSSQIQIWSADCKTWSQVNLTGNSHSLLFHSCLLNDFTKAGLFYWHTVSLELSEFTYFAFGSLEYSF